MAPLEKPGDDAVIQLLEGKDIQYVSFTDWKKIDANEIARGDPKGKPRENIPMSRRCWTLLNNCYFWGLANKNLQ